MEKQTNELISLEEIKKLSKEDPHYRSYMPSDFILASLPLRNVKGPSFQRKMNNVELFITGSGNVPYGKYARLLLSIITTHAVLAKKNDRLVIKYNSITQLTDEMLLPRQRGKDVREQLMLFSMSSFQFREKIKRRVSKSLFEEYKNDTGNFEAVWNNHGNIPFMNKISWIDLNDLDNKKKYVNSVGFSIELSAAFVELCKEHSVPIDYTVYSSISSALGKDLYVWLVYRNNCLEKDGEIYVPRKALIEQFVSSGKEDKDDSERVGYQRLCEQLNIIKEKYYPGLKLEIDKNGDGVTLYKSPAVIREEDKRYILITQDIIGIE